MAVFDEFNTRDDYKITGTSSRKKFTIPFHPHTQQIDYNQQLTDWTTEFDWPTKHTDRSTEHA